MTGPLTTTISKVPFKKTRRRELHSNSRLFFYPVATYIPVIAILIDETLEPRSMTDNQKPKLNKWLIFGTLLGLAALMYGSIMYKIINYGP